MKQFLQRVLILVPALFVLGVSVPALAAPTAGAAICGNAATSSKGEILSGAGEAGTNDCNGTGITNIIASVVSILSLILGIVAVIVIIVAGFKYVTSAGDSGKIASAKSTLIYALVGIVVAALAQILVHFALNTADTATNQGSGTSQNS